MRSLGQRLDSRVEVNVGMELTLPQVVGLKVIPVERTPQASWRKSGRLAKRAGDLKLLEDFSTKKKVCSFRTAEGSPPVLVRKSDTVDSDLSDDARENIVKDVLYVEANRAQFESARKSRGRPCSAASIVADRYGVSKSTVLRVIKRDKETSSSNSKSRSGRPPIPAETVRQIYNENNNRGGATSRTIHSALVENLNDSAPSLATVKNYIRKGYIAPLSIRPVLNDKKRADRLTFALEVLEKKDEVVCHLDECYIRYDENKFGMIFESKEAFLARGIQLIREETYHGHEPKIMIFGAVVAPAEAPQGLPEPPASQCGFFHFSRVQKEGVYKRAVKHKNIVMGDPKFDDIIMGGEIYYTEIVGKDGLLDRLEERYGVYGVGRDYVIFIQEDGAGGHGFNNRAGGKPSDVHIKLENACKARGFEMRKQPANSPDFNLLDLGVWWSLKASVRQRLHEIKVVTKASEGFVRDEIWKFFIDAAEKFPYERLWNIAKAHETNLAEVIRAKGAHLVKQPHAGIRKTFGT